MSNYDAQAIVNSYTECDEASRLGASANTQIMFEIERWFIKTKCPSSGTVIDVGAGPGRYSVEIGKLGRDVVLTDITPKHIDQARQLAEQAGVAGRIVDYRVMDVCDLSLFQDGQFSMAVCYGMLNYTLDQDVHVLSELGRIVGPGNPILISVMGIYGAIRQVWSRGRLGDPAYRKIEAKIVESGLNNFRTPARKFYSAASLRETLEEAGLRVLQMASTPAIAASLGPEMEKARQDSEAWAYVIEMEKKCCTVPGLLDTGEHVIAVAQRG